MGDLEKDRKICERIIKQGGCGFIKCIDCPIAISNPGGCQFSSNIVKLAKRWLEDHPVPKFKVGDIVYHDKFGKGVVQKVDFTKASQYEVFFINYDTLWFRGEDLTKPSYEKPDNLKALEAKYKELGEEINRIKTPPKKVCLTWMGAPLSNMVKEDLLEVLEELYEMKEYRNPFFIKETS